MLLTAYFVLCILTRPICFVVVFAVVSLLLWHDPLTSLLALFCGVLVVVLCEVSGYTMLTLLSYLAALQLITTFVYINGTRLILAIRGVATTAPSTSGMSAPVSAASELEYMYVSQALVLEWSGDVADSINYALNNLAYVLRCRDNAWTIQVIVMFIIAAFVGRIVNGVVLIGLMYVGLFTIPILYVTNQVVCDAYIGQARYVITQWQTILERHLPGFPIKDHTKND